MKKITLSILLPGIVSFYAIQVAAAAVIEEVVVTANKRAENINDIGMSISAISGNTMKEQKVSSLEDIAALVPGLVYTASATNTPIYTLRGVGFNESSLGVYPAVSVYVDEAPLPFPVMASHSAIDLERIEVLKGPQGVLFGQNSTGGAINYIAAKPTQELAYGADFSYSRFNKVEGNGFVSGPLTDKLAGRLSMQSVNSDEWQKSASRDAENGEQKYTTGRLLLDYNLNDRASFSMNLNAWSDQSDPQALQLIAVRPKSPSADTAAVMVASDLTEEDSRAADWSPSATPSSDRDFWQMALRGEFILSDTTNLVTLLSYNDFEQKQVTDGDGSPLLISDVKSNMGSIDSILAEVRLDGITDSLMRWMVGLNYESSDTSEDLKYALVDNSSYRPQTFYTNSSGSLVNQDIESYAVFGNVDFDVATNLLLKLGARYTNTTIDVDSCVYDPGNDPAAIDYGSGYNSADFWNYLGTSVLGDGTPFTPVAGYPGCFSLNDHGVPGEKYIDSLDEDNVSWRMGLEYAMGEDLIYGTLSQGYKAGSYPVLPAATWDQLEPVTQESVLALEVGIKSRFKNDSIQLNAAAFQYKYEDKQVKGKVIAPVFGALDTLVNVDKSTISGLEVDLIALVTSEITLSASATYLDSEVDKYVGYNVYGTQENFSGEPIPFTPELTYSLGVDYRKQLKSGGEFFAGLNAVGQSESDAVFGAGYLALSDTDRATGAHSINEHYFLIESFWTLSGRVGYETADRKWKFMIWGHCCPINQT